MKKTSDMKKTASAHSSPQRPTLMPQQSTRTKPHTEEETLRAIAAQQEQWALANQEERQTLANQEERRALANQEERRALANQEERRALVTRVQVPVPPGIDAFTPDPHPSSEPLQPTEALQSEALQLEALQEDCRVVFAWYENYTQQIEQRLQRQADDYAVWQQARGGVLHRQTAAPPRPLPLRDEMRTELGRAHRHWDTDEGRLLVQVRLCEAALLPKMRAQTASEREAVNAQIAAGVGLAAAAEAGLLAGFVVFWQATGRWPRRPVSVQLLWPGGSRQGARVRGKYGASLTHLQEQARTYFNAGRSQ